jgi:hypothetical protein
VGGGSRLARRSRSTDDDALRLLNRRRPDTCLIVSSPNSLSSSISSHALLSQPRISGAFFRREKSKSGKVSLSAATCFPTTFGFSAYGPTSAPPSRPRGTPSAAILPRYRAIATSSSVSFCLPVCPSAREPKSEKKVRAGGDEVGMRFGWERRLGASIGSDGSERRFGASESR